MMMKRIFRYDPQWPKFRLFRLMWNVGTIGDGRGYSRKIGVALRPKLFEFTKGGDAWRFVVFGVEVHSMTSWGGRFV